MIFNNIDNFSIAEISSTKAELLSGECLCGCSSDDYMASVSSENSSDNYIDFSFEIKKGYFRDCWLEKNNTVTFIMNSPKEMLMTSTELTHLIANIWYTVLCDYLPVERFGSKIRLLNKKCVADFISEVNENGNYTIGYIHLGTELNIPSKDELILNRDPKDKCDIPKENFGEIYNKVFDYIEEFFGGENI